MIVRCTSATDKPGQKCRRRGGRALEDESRENYPARPTNGFSGSRGGIHSRPKLLRKRPEENCVPGYPSAVIRR